MPSVGLSRRVIGCPFSGPGVSAGKISTEWTSDPPSFVPTGEEKQPCVRENVAGQSLSPWAFQRSLRYNEVMRADPDPVGLVTLEGEIGTQTCTGGRPCEDARRKTAVCMPRGEASEGTCPADPRRLDPQALAGGHVCCRSPWGWAWLCSPNSQYEHHPAGDQDPVAEGTGSGNRLASRSLGTVLGAQILSDPSRGPGVTWA